MQRRIDSLPRGIVPMQYAFFSADGGLDLDAFRLQIGACLCLQVGPWDYEDNRRIVLEAIGIFGIDRCMFASNFPVDGLRVTFDRMFGDFRRMIEGLSDSENRKLFHGNAARFYRL